MDLDATSYPRVARSIPALGLHEVLRGWSGEGTIFDDLAAVAPLDALDWTARDVRRRARRVLVSVLEPLIEAMPTTSRRWREFLPAATTSEHEVHRSPTSGVNWRETYRRYGWPPRMFAGRTRRRVTDEIALRSLAWLNREFDVLVEDVKPLSPSSAQALADQSDTIAQALTDWPEAAPAKPDRLDLLALTSSGFPWSVVSAAASLIARAEDDPEFIAYELIAPDPDLGWRLFHLAAYGMVIRALRNHRFVLAWRRPISGSRPGAQIEAIAPSGTRFDLWFEAGSARKVYGLPPSTYHDAVAAIPNVGGSIGVDILLICPHERALLLECKWSEDPSYVGRYGYHQASSYALDARGGLAQQVWSFVVGPDDLVPFTGVSTGLYDNLGVVIGSTSAARVGDVVSAFLADDPSVLS